VPTPNHLPTSDPATPGRAAAGRAGASHTVRLLGVVHEATSGLLWAGTAPKSGGLAAKRACV
jgi:hypothetical protein